MSRGVMRREELRSATLDLGGSAPLELADFTTTGLRIVAIGPSGVGKTNAGLLIAESLAAQGWVSILVDPEGELASLYGTAISDADELRQVLTDREQPIVVVSARDASEFVPLARVILEVADAVRRPMFLMLDEAQLFSTSARSRKGERGESADLVNDIVERGRKRALDIFVTTHRFSGTIHRSLFSNATATLVGTQRDPSAWSALAPLCRAPRLSYSDLAALSPGEFFCFAPAGVEKVRMPMSQALQRVAIKARPVRSALPTNFGAWDRALRALPTERLRALTPEVCALLGAIAGLSAQQMLTGTRALADELEARA